MRYTYTGLPGRYKIAAIMDVLIALAPTSRVYVQGAPDGSSALMDSDVLTAEQIGAVIAAHDPNALTPSEQEAIARAADRAAIRQAQADAAIAAIGAELTQANADLAGWDAMTTADKMAATKRMLARQIEIEQRQRKIIKYARWL